jgi:hypothetical protein
VTDEQIAEVSAGLSVLRAEGRRIWGDDAFDYFKLDEIVVRLMVGVGDLARATRDGGFHNFATEGGVLPEDVARGLEIKKELGNILFSTIRWIDDLNLDPLECLDLAIAAQEAFVKSGRPR